MKLTSVLSVLLLLVLAAAPPGQAGDLAEDWEGFTSRFLLPEGRIIDTYQKDGSHSEGQGYAMLLAAVLGDQPVFELLWEWTEATLQVRPDDALFAWNYRRNEQDVWGVVDMNNATDGDMLIAFALLIGAEKWDRPDLLNAALPIIASIRTKLVLEKDGRLLLLPGFFGFEHDNGVVLNPSYGIFAALRAFAVVDDEPFWNRLHDDTLALVREALFSQYRLPADWVIRVDGELRLPADKPPVFGYEAVRVPLYLAWSGLLEHLPRFGHYLAFTHGLGRVPAIMDLQTGAPSADEASAGVHAIFARAAEELGLEEQAALLWTEAGRKKDREAPDYYSSVLHLLAQIDVSGVPLPDRHESNAENLQKNTGESQ
ncbi:glycosyl hydrolase family 8 [Desulfonatronum thioautotrophicum]|uniref:glycosyl hydrolase family 8 n=1 Tax=Desulfonatronum thioautotrophicum TaxID=617001 RepID=UPI00069B6615|nr:glycosyl hydrolase family 8 [Desulfonatronum thioautotrophicum]